MCRGHDPLFSGKSALPSLPIYHQCATHVPPLIFQGKPAPENLLLETHAAHTHQKKLSAPWLLPCLSLAISLGTTGQQ